jgi:hypothetical protein
MPFIRAAVLAERLLEDREARKAKSEQAGAFTTARCLSIAARAVTADFAVINVAPITIIPDRSRSTPSNLRTGESLLVVIPITLVATPMTRVSGGGWGFDCCGCGRVFESAGSAYCKPGCRRASAERAEAAALMAEVGIDAPVKRQCQGSGCTNTIRWRNGRAVPKATKFCL